MLSGKNLRKSSRYTAILFALVSGAASPLAAHAKVRAHTLESMVRSSETIAIVKIDNVAHLKDDCGFIYSAVVTNQYSGNLLSRVKFRASAGLVVGANYLVFFPTRNEVLKRNLADSDSWFEHAKLSEKKCQKSYPKYPSLYQQFPRDIFSFNENMEVGTGKKWLELGAYGDLKLSKEIRTFSLLMDVPEDLREASSIKQFSTDVVDFDIFEHELKATLAR